MIKVNIKIGFQKHNTSGIFIIATIIINVVDQ
jgi:hypothetical protein